MGSESTRTGLQGSRLSVCLVKALHRYEVDPERGTVLEQVGRVAANLGADNREPLDRPARACAFSHG